MSSWTLQQRYGSGSARILLPAPPIFRSGGVAALPTRSDPVGSGLAIAVIALGLVFALRHPAEPVVYPSDLRIVWLEPVLEESVPMAALALPRRPQDPVPVIEVAKPPPAQPARMIQLPPPTPAQVVLREVPTPSQPAQIDSLTAPRTAITDSPVRPRIEFPEAEIPRGRAPVHFDMPLASEARAEAQPASAGRPEFVVATAVSNFRPPKFTLPVEAVGPPGGSPRAAVSFRPARLPVPHPRSSRPPEIAMPQVARSANAGRAGILPSVASAPPTLVAAASGAASAGDPALRGVSLGTLAACTSGHREDLLKQRVIASVTTRKRCASDAGTYRFIETRNLNAFLMWVDRNPSRPEANRCGELELALNCLGNSDGKETRTQ